jgi:ligand-binding sensor domain-containing protein
VIVTASLLLAVAARGSDNWTTVTTETEKRLPGNEIQFLENGADGRVWIGTQSGLGYYKDGAFSSVEKRPGKKWHMEAWDVLEISADEVWIGHGNGAIRMRGGKAEEMLKGNTVAPIVPFGDGVLWAIGKNRGTERNALYEYRGGAWSKVKEFAKKRVIDLNQAKDGTAWLTIEGNGVYEIDPRKGVEAAVHHLKGLNVTAVGEDPKGRIWCGLWGRGIQMYDGQAWTAHLPKEKGAILSIVSDKDGAIYATTDRGCLWRYDGKQWRKELKDEGMIHLLEATSDGSVWVNSQDVEGLRRRTGGSWKVSFESPMPIRCVLQSRDGTVFAGGILDGLHMRK